MTNVELLKSAGFIEKDGWLYTPNLTKEPIFRIDNPDELETLNEKSLSWIFQVISATSYNLGWNDGRKCELELSIDSYRKELIKLQKRL